MSEILCAVCGKGKGPEKCEVCGFSDNGSINRQFPIREDLEKWLETVVNPYKLQWEGRKREEVLKKRNRKFEKRISKLLKDSRKKKEALNEAKKREDEFCNLYRVCKVLIQLEAKKREKELLAQLEELREKVEKLFDDFFNSGYAYYEKKDYDHAIEDYTQAIRIDPNYADAYIKRSLAYYEKKDYDRAIEDCTQVIRINPNYAYAFLIRGFAYREKNDYDRAIEDCTQAIKIDPNYVHAYRKRGYVYFEKKDYDHAIEDYTQAIRINPNDDVTFFKRGNAYREKEDYDRAIEDYTQAIKINPNYADAYKNRSLVYSLKGEMFRANANADNAKVQQLKNNW